MVPQSLLTSYSLQCCRNWSELVNAMTVQIKSWLFKEFIFEVATVTCQRCLKYHDLYKSIRQKIYRKENTWNKNIILKVFSLHSLLAQAIHSQTTIKKLKGYLGVIKVRNWGWKDFIVGLFRSLPYLLRCTTTEVIKGNNRKLHFGFPTFSYSVSRKKNH